MNSKDEEDNSPLDAALRNVMSNLVRTYQQIGAAEESGKDMDKETVGLGVFSVNSPEGEVVSVAIREIHACSVHHTITISGLNTEDETPLAITIDPYSEDMHVWDPSEDEDGHGHPHMH